MGKWSREDWDLIGEMITGQRIRGQATQLVTEQSATQRYTVGSRLALPDGSIYRYCQAGAVALAAGQLQQAPVPDANHLDLVPAADYAIGTKVIGLTVAGANIAANQYAGGWLYVNQGVGLGQKVRIISHPAAIIAAVCLFTCADPLSVAITIVGSECSLIANPYDDVVVTPAAVVGAGTFTQIVGVPNCIVALTAFGWSQTWGPCPVLVDGVVYLNGLVVPSTGTLAVAGVAGAVMHATISVLTGATAAAAVGNATNVVDSTGAEGVIELAVAAASTRSDLGPTMPIIGKVMRVDATTDYGLIDLCISR